jgi:hypothetical protein
MEEVWGECWDNTRTGVFPFMAFVLEIGGVVEVEVEMERRVLCDGCEGREKKPGKVVEGVAEMEAEVEE